MSHLRQLLADVLAAQGVLDPQRAAELSLEALRRVEVLRQAEQDRFERDAAIYRLHGSRVGVMVLAARFEMDRVTIYRVLRTHAKKRRQALKLVS